MAANSRKRNGRRSLKALPPQGSVLNVQIRNRVLQVRRARVVARAFLIGLCAVCLTIGVVVAIRAAIIYYFIENPKYAIATIDLDIDGPIRNDLVLETSGIRTGESLFLADIGGARQRLEAMPQVAQAQIVRAMPNQIKIKLRTRKAVAWLAPSHDADDEALARETFLVDGKGFVFPELEPNEAHYRLPFIYGAPDLPVQPGQTLRSREALAALELIRITNENPIGARLQLQSLDLTKRYCMEVLDRRRTLFLFGTDPQHLREQVDQLASLLSVTDQEGRRLQRVNLLVRRNIPVVFAGATPVDLPPVAKQPRIEPQSTARPVSTPRPAAVKPAREARTTPRPAAVTQRAARSAATPARSTTSPSVKRGAHDVPLRPFIP